MSILTMYLSLLCVLLQLLKSTGADDSWIRGGRDAKPHSRPYMASVQSRKHHVCGGLLIQRDFVLTSGHCRNYRPLQVLLGAHNISKVERTQQWIDVQHYYRHPFHQKSDQLDYDIMLLKLKTNATLNKNVKVISLPGKHDIISENSKCSVAGWGLTKTGGTAGGVLQEIDMKIQKNTECKRTWRKYYFSKQMICTHPDNKKGFCQGDSGGPIVCDSLPQGIVAYNGEKDLHCEEVYYPNVYMKIQPFRSWIDDVIERYK
ncbi:hypothetical protein AGOR_G00217710 [Albula goreensis]|uniref:trypsin n=1 Tax=Albula goreensis TaxID=1534307 RepID=A0A8T3CRM9_9TELE|nr:hypothetical protein AGOR_G00217710 [Albula goreensis]